MALFLCVLQEGYWELTTELGELINVNVDLFANVFLKNKGIHSLGESSFSSVLGVEILTLYFQVL